MSPKGPDKILNTLIQNQSKGAILRKKLAANKKQNWLLALVLHSFSKFDKGFPLTKLEQSIVNAFKTHGFSDARLKMFGQIFAKLPPDLKEEFFPADFGSLTPKVNFGVDQLKEKVPVITDSFMEMENVTKIDVEALQMGALKIDTIAELPVEILGKYTANVQIPISSLLPPKEPVPCKEYTIKASKFTCKEETGWSWTGSDEPYFIFSSTASGMSITTKSHVFGDINSGNSANFGTSEGWIWGQDHLPHEVPKAGVGASVVLMEHDAGDPEEARAAVSAAFAAADAILVAGGVTAWIAAVVSAVGALVVWLVGYLDEDFIGQHVIVFTPDFLDAMHDSFSYIANLTDGDAEYTLSWQVTKV